MLYAVTAAVACVMLLLQCDRPWDMPASNTSTTAVLPRCQAYQPELALESLYKLLVSGISLIAGIGLQALSLPLTG